MKILAIVALLASSATAATAPNPPQPPIVYGVADDSSKYADDGGAEFYKNLLGAALGGVLGYLFAHRPVSAANPPLSEPERRANRVAEMTKQLSLT